MPTYNDIRATVLSQELKHDLQNKTGPLIEESFYDMYNRGKQESEKSTNSKLAILYANLDNSKVTDKEYRDLVCSVLDVHFFKD